MSLRDAKLQKQHTDICVGKGSPPRPEDCPRPRKPLLKPRSIPPTRSRTHRTHLKKKVDTTSDLGTTGGPFSSFQAKIPPSPLLSSNNTSVNSFGTDCSTGQCLLLATRPLASCVAYPVGPIHVVLGGLLTTRSVLSPPSGHPNTDIHIVSSIFFSALFFLCPAPSTQADRRPSPVHGRSRILDLACVLLSSCVNCRPRTHTDNTHKHARILYIITFSPQFVFVLFLPSLPTIPYCYYACCFCVSFCPQERPSYLARAPLPHPESYWLLGFVICRSTFNVLIILVQPVFNLSLTIHSGPGCPAFTIICLFFLVIPSRASFLAPASVAYTVCVSYYCCPLPLKPPLPPPVPVGFLPRVQSIYIIPLLSGD